MYTTINRSAYIASAGNGPVSFMFQIVASGDWSLAKFYGEEGLRNKPDLAKALFVKFFSMGAKRVYAPTPVEFNGKVIAPEAFTTSMELYGLGGSAQLLRNEGCPADGTLLRNIGDAGTFSGGGCPMIVATYKQHMVFAHAGRDCVLDRVRVNSFDKQEGRLYGSVVNSVMEALREESFEGDAFDPKKVCAWIYGSIRTEDFTHPLNDAKYGLFNGRMYGYVVQRFGSECASMENCVVRLDLPALIRKQFLGLEVPGWQIDLTHAYLPKHFPTTRSDRNTKYLATVVRTS